MSQKSARSKIQVRPEVNFLSELYFDDCPNARLLAEYPSSNNEQTQFKNFSKFIIHDPFPPPPRELIKFLGPHHLMCGWGKSLAVTSEVAPPQALLEHWKSIFGEEGCPNWLPYDAGDDSSSYVTLFPHESIHAGQQVIEPTVNYAIHSKEVIEKINCPQADVLGSAAPPCIVKLSHGYAGLGNFFVRDSEDQSQMQKLVADSWPDATLVFNSILEDIVGDFGVQFYLSKDGTITWLGLTEQLFNEKMRWCGGVFSQKTQQKMFEPLCQMIEPAGEYLHSVGYFGLVGIDILQNKSGEFFLVDVNPRLTGISPFLMASRIFQRSGLDEGVYQASCRFKGTLDELIHAAEASDARVLVLSAFESGSETDTTQESANVTICHLSVTSESQDRNREILKQLL